ncbi:MAG: tubulin-like doman-containing protein, partial [Thermoanaerobaculia bacterium]
PELHPDIHANTYAALKELEHLTKLDYGQVKREGRTAEDFVFYRDENSREVMQVETRPFFISFIFDRPPHLGLPDVQAAIADAAFLQIFTPIIDNLAGELDNYEKNLEELTRFPGDLRTVGLGYTKNFGAFGAVALVLPGHDLLEYCARRFAAQAIRSQITFGVDSGDPGDDRARALAKLAVDYSDPKFLNMSDEGRERAINESFIASVQEMARQDAVEEITDGFWFQLAESIDRGRVTGSDEKGEPVRAEPTIEQIDRKLSEIRADLLNKVSIKERAFVFHREGLNQYIEYVSRLSDDIRGARQLVDEGVRGLETSAGEGEAITDLKLDPIAERYLVVRLLGHCESAWIPEAKQQLDKAKKRDVGNPSVRERLERELYESLQEAASRRRLFGRDQVFYDARDEAQEYYRGVAAAAKKTLDAEVRLRQLRALLEYLRRRSRQYARLATRMDAMVQDLERDAERLRRGESAIVPTLALRVEVFETLDEPRQRIWDRVYGALFLDRGRYITTFDRQILARTISGELKPVVQADGRVVKKSVDRTVADLRRALIQLGNERLRPTIFGEGGQPGLDLARGLELEARLMLEPGKQVGDEVTDDELEGYEEKKFRALAQMAGVFARVKTADSRALDDGVKVNRTRQLIVGLGDAASSKTSGRFTSRLKSLLSVDGRQVKVDQWHDPRLIIVHDVELPIPLYYLEPVTEEIEEAYLRLAADEQRSYNLHTDFNWEKSLPNLNPRRSEITIGWSLQVLAEGLVTRAISFQEGSWVWHVAGLDESELLGRNLSSALYRIGEIHRNEDLQNAFERQLREVKNELGPEREAERRSALVDQLEILLNQMNRRELRGEMTREDILDRPVLRALITELQEGKGLEIPSRAAAGGLYDHLKL